MKILFFSVTGKHKNNDLKQPFPLKESQIDADNGVEAVKKTNSYQQYQFIRYRNIWQREQNKECMRPRDSWQGLPIEKALFSPPTAFILRWRDDKEHQLISKK